MTSASSSYGQLAAEREFLLARAEDAGGWMANPKRWTGTSSNVLVTFVFGGPEPTEREYPRDPSDLMACYRTVDRLPEHLKARGASLLPRYREVVRARYPLDELDALVTEEGLNVA
jgi:hypothetical protein